MVGKTFVLLTGLVMSMASYAERLPVDDAIDGLRAEATHLEIMKDLLTKNRCTVHLGPHQFVLTAGAMRGSGIVMGVADSIPGQYLAFHQAPKAQLLHQVISVTHQRAINRAFIISSSLKAKPGAETYTHLYVVLAQPLYNKHLDGTDYVKVAIHIPLDAIEKGVESKELTVQNGGSFKVACNK